jgi:preprotein translocase subunit SecG
MLYYVVTSLYVLVCLLLLIVVLLQQGRAGDIAAAFGGSSSQTAFGARSGATLLTRATSVLAVLFMVGSLALAIAWQKGGGSSSVVSGVKLPSAPAAPATPAKK